MDKKCLRKKRTLFFWKDEIGAAFLQDFALFCDADSFFNVIFREFHLKLDKNGRK